MSPRLVLAIFVYVLLLNASYAALFDPDLAIALLIGSLVGIGLGLILYSHLD